MTTPSNNPTELQKAIERFERWCNEWLHSKMALEDFQLILSAAKLTSEVGQKCERDLESDSPVASCQCGTKTNEPKYHKPGCKYRLIIEREQLEQKLKAAEESAHYANGTAELAIQHRDDAEQKLEAVEKERDEFDRICQEHADSFERLNNQCKQLHSLAKQLAEAIQRAFTLSAMRSEPYIPPDIRTLFEETLDKALSLAKEQGLIP